MTLRFDNSHLLWLLPLVALPLLLHLFARARPPTMAFSSVEFILRAVRANAQVKRPRDLLLLILRTLLLAALLAAFARPVLHVADVRTGEGTSLVLIVDASASMRCMAGAQTRFAQACAKASDLLAQLRRGDQAGLIWAAHTPRSVFPTLAVNIAHLQRETRKAQCSFEDADTLGALRLAVEMLADAPGRRQVCIISDFQRTAWEHVEVRVPEGMDLLTLPVGRGPSANLALTHLVCSPVRPVRGEPVHIRCDISNFSDAPRIAAIHLEVGTRRLEETANLAPWSEGSIRFLYAPDRVGAFPVTATLRDPDFVPDNRRHLRIDVIRARRAALAGDDDPANWAAVLRVLPGVVLETVVSGDDLPTCDALVLSGWSADTGPLLHSAVEAGVTVLFQPSADMPADTWDALFGEDADSAEAAPPASASGPVTIARPEATGPVLGVFSASGIEDLCALQFGPVASVPRTRFEDVLLAFSDGTPALAHHGTPNGHLLLWNLPLGREHSDLITFPEVLLPLVGESLSAFSAKTARTPRALFPGERLRVPEDLRGRPGDLILAGPGEVVIPITGSASDRAALSAPVPRPGVYEWRVDGRDAGFDLVNFPDVESDLRCLPEPPSPGRASVLSGGRAYERRREGIPLWPRFYTLALAALACEILILLRGQRGSFSPAVIGVHRGGA